VDMVDEDVLEVLLEESIRGKLLLLLLSLSIPRFGNGQ